MRRVTRLSWLLLIALAGCKSPAKPAPNPSDSGATVALPLALPFIEDDYAKALADARAHHRPIFVDVWATWCHTCLSLRNFVFTDPAVGRFKDAFTWLAIDSEKPENAAVVERLGLQVLPTLWILDPADEKPTWTWKGALTTSELTSALDGVSARRGALADAEAAAAKGDDKLALERYRALFRSLASSDGGASTNALAPSERGRAADAFVTLLMDDKALDECAEVAHREGPSLPEGTYRVDVAANGAGCAMDAKPRSPARALLPAFVAELATLTKSRSDAVLVDDRSSAYDSYVAALKATGDEAGAKKAATDWAKLLEDAAARAKSPRERAVFDAHRLNAYLELGDPARALPMLDATERDFPDDYNPSARKAKAYFELGRFDDALASVDRALARAYGGRRLRLYLLKADILEKKGAPDQARAALEAGLADTKSMPLRKTYARLREALAERLNARSQPTAR